MQLQEGPYGAEHEVMASEFEAMLLTLVSGLRRGQTSMDLSALTNQRLLLPFQGPHLPVPLLWKDSASSQSATSPGERTSLVAIVGGVRVHLEVYLRSEEKQQSKHIWSSRRWSQGAAGTSESCSLARNTTCRDLVGRGSGRRRLLVGK